MHAELEKKNAIFEFKFHLWIYADRLIFIPEL